METIREFFNRSRDSGCGPAAFIDALETREKQVIEHIRAEVLAAEKERVQDVLIEEGPIPFRELQMLFRRLYPRAESEKLPAGYYELNNPVLGVGGVCFYRSEPFFPEEGCTYRRLVYEDEIRPKQENANV